MTGLFLAGIVRWMAIATEFSDVKNTLRLIHEKVNELRGYL